MKEKLKDLWAKIKPNILPYAVAIAIPLTVGTISALLTKDSMGVYGELNSPPLAPPGWLFPIVWTVLFVLMGVSSAMIYLHLQRNPQDAKRGLIFYAASLAVNFSWSIVFFNLQAAFLALIVLALLIYLIIMTVFNYRKVWPIAAFLQLPYLIWTLFAFYLNAGIWLLN